MATIYALRRGLALALAIQAGTAAAATADASCRRQAIARLQASSPNGTAMYRLNADRSFFESWIDCADVQFDLSTAVHETAHVVAAETDAFPLVGGGSAARPHEATAFFPPWRIAGRFAPDDFVMLYLRRGKASSSTDFLYLLDEFDAYSHDLATAVDLRALRRPDETIDHRDGLAAMMAFVTVYAETARAAELETWAGLRRAPVAGTIQALWRRAERVMASSCGIPGFGSADKAYLRQVCAAGGGSAIATILGRAPACPEACLAPEAGEAAQPASDSGTEEKDATERAGVERAGLENAELQTGGPEDGDVVIESETVVETPVHDRPRHPFGAYAAPRRHGTRVVR